jgi:hypothetical protein
MKRVTIEQIEAVTHDEGARRVLNELTADEFAYAFDPARGAYRGFAALGDLCDHNMLIPFADELDLPSEDDEAATAAWERYLNWCNAVTAAFNRIGLERWEQQRL